MERGCIGAERSSGARYRGGVLALVTLLVLAAGCYGERVKTAGQGEIFFKPPVTKDQAVRLGAFLKSVDFFDGSKRKSVQLMKKGDVYQLRYVVVEGALNNLAAIKALKLVSGMAAREVLGGAQVEVQLCNARFKTQHSELLPKGFGDFGERMIFSKGELFIRKPITAVQGKQLGERLVALKFFDDTTRKSVQATLVDGVYQLRFVAKKELAGKHAAVFLAIAFDLSLKVLGGAPVQALLCDEALEPFQKLPPVEAGTRLAFGKGELFYTRGVDVAQAQALGVLLQQLNYFGSTQTRAVQLRRDGSGLLVGFVVRRGSERAPATLTVFRELAGKLAPAFGQASFKVQLVDPTFRLLSGL